MLSEAAYSPGSQAIGRCCISFVLIAHTHSRIHMICYVCVVYLSTPPPPTTTNPSITPRSADKQSAGPANTGPRRTATEDKGRVIINRTLYSFLRL